MIYSLSQEWFTKVILTIQMLKICYEILVCFTIGWWSEWNQRWRVIDFSFKLNSDSWKDILSTRINFWFAPSPPPPQVNSPENCGGRKAFEEEGSVKYKCANPENSREDRSFLWVQGIEVLSSLGSGSRRNSELGRRSPLLSLTSTGGSRN